MPDVELFDYGCQGENQMRITTGQIAELLAQDKDGQVTWENFQEYLQNPDKFSTRSDGVTRDTKGQKVKKGNFNIAHINNFFQEYFGEPVVVPESITLQVATPSRDMMTGREILEELDPKPLTLEQLIGRLPGLTKSLWYLAFILDKHKFLRIVAVYWTPNKGWTINAFPMDTDYKWANAEGLRVFLGQ